MTNNVRPCGELSVGYNPRSALPLVHAFAGVSMEWRQVGFMGPWETRLLTGTEAKCWCGKRTITREWS